MSYTTLEQIKIRLDEYDISDAVGEQTLVFHTGKIDYKLNEMIEKAKQDIIGYRHYPSSYTAEKIAEDVESKYHNLLIDLVLYDYSVDGANYETNHSENGVNRTFATRESILGKVIPFCNVL